MGNYVKKWKCRVYFEVYLMLNSNEVVFLKWMSFSNFFLMGWHNNHRRGDMQSRFKLQFIKVKTENQIKNKLSLER